MRVETGVVQFGDDWPGVFIRGDQAFDMALKLQHIQSLIDSVEELDFVDTLYTSVLQELIKLCTSTDLRSAAPVQHINVATLDELYGEF